MLGGRRRRTSTSRNEDGKGWAHESDSDRPRPTMMASQRPNVEYATDRHHRTSRRPDPSGNPPAASAHPAPKGPSSRDYVDAGGSSYYTSSQSQNQAAYPQMATGAASSRTRAPDTGHESNTMLAYLKRKTERRSPRSSDEKVHASGHTKSSRQQPRTSVVPTAAIATSSTRPQPMPESGASRDKERDREKRRQRELEKEKLRAEEERYRAAAAALEADKERQRRREEKEHRRAEREKEKERERRKEEKEFERARKHREKERLREKESRPRDDGRAPLPGVVYPYQTVPSSGKYHTEGRGSLDQVPSSSSNVALPPPQYASAYAAAGGRTRTTSDPRRDEIPSATAYNAPPLVPEKERKPHRSRRDKVPQQYGGESGMSSSEQEHSGRERATRSSDRRRHHRDYQTDPQQSGPSGSDTERASRDRRRASRVPNDPYNGTRHQSSGSVPLVAQPSATVGSASLPRYTPQIVSIRAGQGPADPDTPQMRAKAALNQARSRDTPTQFPTSAQFQSYQQGAMPQGYAAPQGYVPAVATYRNEAPPDVHNTSYQPSPHALLRPSTTPRSVAVPIPPSNQAQRPSPASNHKVPLKPSPGRNEAVLNLSVYHPPGPAVSTELLLPHQYSSQTQTVTVNHTTVQDLAAKFPLHEDALTSASSSTLAPGTGRDTTQRRGAQQADGHHRHPDTDAYSRTVASVPAESLSTPYTGATYPTPSKQSHALYGENDVPIPIPGPRRNSLSVPADTRGQKSSSSNRPQPLPLQSKSSGVPAVQPYPSADYAHDPPHSASKYTAGATTVSGQPQISNSPSRSVQQYLQRSPSTINAAPPAGGTPKQSSSIRLQPRNGSSDTVVYPVGKGSPHDASRSIRHSNSNTGLQTYATSRPDTTIARATNPVSDYPDAGRRPSTSPYTPNNSQPAAYHYYSPHPSTYAHHSRTASQPTVPYPAFEYEPALQRSQTQPVPSTPSANPAAAPSASAIVAAYRSGQYNTDQLQRVQPPPTQRAPPRSAPSPAPTLTQQQYAPASSIMSKSGYPLPPNASQPVRGQSYSAPSASRPSGPTHSRTVSDPQFSVPATVAATSTRVAVAGHPSTPAPPKAQLMLHPTASEQELLMTPSSIAQSMLKGPHAPQSSARPPSIQGGKAPSDKEGRRRGILGLFRSRSSPPKPGARNPVAGTSGPAPTTKPRQRSSSQTTINAVAASVRNIIAPHPQPTRPSTARPAARSGSPFGEGAAPSVRPPLAPAPEPEYDPVNASPRRRTAESIVAPRPVHAVSPEAHRSGRKSPNSKVFTPFRLISKKHRTVSAASVEALDGTAANTLIGGESARSSTAGRPSPPLRDTYTATQDWRNKEEEELRDRGTWRRRRPGVVFDVMDEFTETETHHPARKQPRR